MTQHVIQPQNRRNRFSPSSALAGRLVPGLLILVSATAFLTRDAKAQNNPGFTAVNDRGVGASLTWTGGAGPFLLQKKLNFSDPSWVNVLTTSNRGVILAKEAQSGMVRLQDQPTNTVLAFTVLLSPASEVPAVNNSSGSAIGALSLEGSNLNYYVTFSGLSGPATAAHFHASATPTNNAGVMIPLSPPAATSGVIAGSVQLSLAQITNFLSGLCYMNIHTALNPGGEIRGQVVPLRMVVAMNGASEVPASTSTGTGNGILTFIGSQLFYEINFSGLSASATAAHIHGAASPQQNAGVIIPFSGVPGATSGTISGTATVTPQQLAYILAGETYVNIHTTANPGGEIRGQIWPIQFGASMSASSEVPPNASTGTAFGMLTLISNVLSYNFTFTNLTSNATAAHIHGPASPQQNAGVIIPFTGVPAATSGSFSGTALLTPQQLFDIITGLTYANIHTTVNPGGEVRGQVYPGN